MQSLRIGLDYDNTFTACPALWAKFIANAREMKHRVIIVTARRDTAENYEEIKTNLEHWGCSTLILFCNLGSKIHATNKAGLPVDIWIDDDPITLVQGH